MIKQLDAAQAAVTNVAKLQELHDFKGDKFKQVINQKGGNECDSYDGCVPWSGIFQKLFFPKNKEQLGQVFDSNYKQDNNYENKAVIKVDDTNIFENTLTQTIAPLLNDLGNNSVFNVVESDEKVEMAANFLLSGDLTVIESYNILMSSEDIIYASPGDSIQDQLRCLTTLFRKLKKNYDLIDKRQRQQQKFQNLKTKIEQTQEIVYQYIPENKELMLTKIEEMFLVPIEQTGEDLLNFKSDMDRIVRVYRDLIPEYKPVLYKPKPKDKPKEQVDQYTDSMGFKQQNSCEESTGYNKDANWVPDLYGCDDEGTYRLSQDDYDCSYERLIERRDFNINKFFLKF